jgi:acyl-CoA synthetase (NDP forming)
MTEPVSNLEKLFHPKAVAIVGASRSSTTYSGRLLAKLNANQRDCKIYPINPSATEIGGHRAYRSLEELPVSVDVAAVMRRSDETLSALASCVDLGVSNAILFNAVASDTRGYNAEIRRLISGSGTRVVGPNCMGVYDLYGGPQLTYSNLESPNKLVPGMGIAVLGHSGGAVQSIAAHAIELGAAITHFASLGNEADLKAHDLVDYFLDQPEVGVVAAYLEEIRDPQSFLRAAEKARSLNKHIVVLRVGRSEVARTIAQSHTGAMVGSLDHEAAFLTEAGVHLVSNLREAGVVAASVRVQTAAAGSGLGVVTLSGGISSILADLSYTAHVDLPNLSPATLDVLYPRLASSGLVDPNVSNPIDLGSPGVYDADLWRDAVLSLIKQDDIGVCLVVSSDAYFSRVPEVIDAARQANKVLAFLLFRRDDRRYKPLASEGVLAFTSDEECVRGINAILRAAEMRRMNNAQCRKAEGRSGSVPVIRPGSVEADVKSWLEDLGILSPRRVLVEDVAHLGVATRGLDFPVVLKISDSRVVHKTDAGGVQLDVGDLPSLRMAWQEMSARIEKNGFSGPHRFLVEEQIPTTAAEWIIGARNDFGYGPVVVVGVGGVLAEAAADTKALPAPVDVATATEMIRSLRAWDVLERRNLVSPKELDALASTVATVSDIAYAARGWLRELDLNPVVVTGRGSIVLDSSAVADAPGEGESAPI